MTTKIADACMTIEAAKAHMMSIGEKVSNVFDCETHFYVYSKRCARGTMGASAVIIEGHKELKKTFLCV